MIIGGVAGAVVLSTVLVLIGLNPGVGRSHTADADPRGGISASRAADLARPHVQDGAVFVSAVAEFRDVFTITPPGGRQLDAPNRLVWAVTFDVEVEICPPNGAPCWSPRPGQIQVILDYITGQFLESATFAPA